MKHNRIFAILMVLMMVFTFMPTMAFADTGSPSHGLILPGYHWSEDHSTCVYVDEDQDVHDATVTSETTDPTCTADGFTVFTAKWANEDPDVVTVVDEDSALGHDWEFVESTLVQGQGLTGYWECSRCELPYSDTTMTLIDVEETDETCWDNGTITKAGNLIDPEGVKVTIEGTREVPNSSHDALHKIEHFAAVAPTCTIDGNKEYWHCTEDDNYFVEEATDEEVVKVLVTSDGVVVPATGHKYQVKYNNADAWTSDKSKCKAVATCTVCGDKIEENGVITSEITQAPTSTEKGVTTYTAKFENSLFETQTLEVQDVPYVWEMIWSDYTVENAYAQKMNEDGDLVKVPPVAIDSETKDGVTTYTATFLLGSEIGPFTDEVVNENPMKVVAKKSVKASAKKNTTIKKAIVVKDAAGKVTYKKVSGNKKITVTKSGKIKVKKGLKKGKTYILKVKVNAAGNNDYVAGSKTVKIKVKVGK